MHLALVFVVQYVGLRLIHVCINIYESVCVHVPLQLMSVVSGGSAGRDF